jgi:hypothetical protein
VSYRAALKRAVLIWLALLLFFPAVFSIQRYGIHSGAFLFGLVLAPVLAPGYAFAELLKPINSRSYLHVPSEEQFLYSVCVYVGQLFFLLCAAPALVWLARYRRRHIVPKGPESTR